MTTHRADRSEWPSWLTVPGFIRFVLCLPPTVTVAILIGVLAVVVLAVLS